VFEGALNARKITPCHFYTQNFRICEMAFGRVGVARTLDKMVLVSVDDHVIEPADMFEKHIPARFKDRAPRVATRTDGTHHSVFEGRSAPGLGPNAVMGRHDIGVDMMTWECDYPHSDSVWPKSPEFLWEQIRGIPGDEIDKITHLNVMREFSYDPLAIFGRENCTVAAMRAQASNVDVTPMSRGGLKPMGAPQKPVTTDDVRKVLSHV
jgi:hypothetical protein